MASDGESDEDFVTYGTPLEPLEEDEPLKKPIPVQDQTVRDEKGRYKRFHGAFTGGFSAGYFNTVGSKEGWTPSSFVSSRQQKAERQNARPEDFMDEEDLSEHGIAPREIITTDDFASGRKDQIKDKARAITSLTAPIPGDTLLEDLIAPAKSSIGVELLRKMGWKDGQGIGPRVKRRQRKQKTGLSSVYGCALPPSGSEESEDDDDEFAPENVTFAPKDVTPIDFTPKDDLHGLGYRGINPHQALMGGSGAGHINLFTLESDRMSNLFGDQRHQRQGGVSGQAFGVGALEEDDADIYHRDAMSNYDTVLGGEEPGDGLYGWTAPQEYRKRKKDSKKDASYLGKILEGFTLASNPAEITTVFPPPVLPRDYRPVHHFRPVVDLSTVSPLVAQALQNSRGHLSQHAQQQGRHQLDSSQRRELLGETSLEGPSSVFELLSSKDREKLAAISKKAEEKSSTPDMSSEEGRAAVVTAAKASALQALSSRFQSSSPQAPHQAQPQAANTQLALNAWSGTTTDPNKTFRPFEKNPQKQARYDLYISKLKQGDKDALELSLDPTMTEWERGRERDEFVRAALLYKPSTSFLSSRFTRAKQEDDTDAVEVTRDQENDVDDKQAAVKMKMFGKLTRDTFEWHPDKLLCKRFNVPDPYPGSGIVGMPKVKRDKFSVFNFLTMTDGTPISKETTAAPSQTTPKPADSNKKSRWDMPGRTTEAKDPLSEFLTVARKEASASLQDQPVSAAKTENTNTTAEVLLYPTQEPEKEQKNEDNEAEEEESRPPMDLFKAIFASSSDEKSSSSEDDSEEEDEPGPDPEQGVPQGQWGSQTKEPINISTKPLDPPLPALTTPTQLSGNTTEKTHISEQSGSNAEMAVTAEDPQAEEFGPRLPPPPLPSQTLSLFTPSAEEKHKKKSKEKHKAKKEHKHKKDKKHKKKHRKHKHKGKQKKKKREEERQEEESGSSSDDSDDDSSDVAESGTVSTEELLKRLKSLRGKQL
ncbi:G patch domain-containing protein 1 [Chanos chanos]|uniref:G patch domain-containing protein 1 n=1 Tax=Chanos chanos TaxID=29144 RepID=A0A6J2UNK3_CHACN|nr:G patch domain-containing protein 1 [Chanos chanos]